MSYHGEDSCAHQNVAFQWLVHCVISFRGPTLDASCREIQFNVMKGPVQTTVYPISSCRFLPVFISLHLSPSLCSRLSMYRQGCALRTSFRLQSTGLPGYTWQWAVKQDMWISPRHNGFVKPMLRQTDGEERTAKVEGTTAEQSRGVQWYRQLTAVHCTASGFSATVRAWL